MKRRTNSRTRQGLALALSMLVLLWPAAGAFGSSPSSVEPLDRVVGDAELATVVGGTGGGGTPIGFGDTLEATVSSENAIIRFAHTVPSAGPNNSVTTTFQVTDLSGLNGTYEVEIFDLTAGASLHTESPPVDPSQPTVIKDFALPQNNKVQIRVKEVAGPVPRSFEIKMSHRYSYPPEGLALGFDDFESYSFQNGAFVTLALQVSDSAPDQLGEADVFFNDGGIAGTNVVRVLGPDRVALKAEKQGAGDLSVDNSDFPGLSFDEPGEYLVVVSNTQVISGVDPFTLFVGPYPGQDDEVGKCELIDPAPSFTTTVNTGTLNLQGVGDRDCFEFVTNAAFTEVGFSLTQSQNISGGGANEVRVSQEDENDPGTILFVNRKKGSGSLLNQSVAVSANTGGSPLVYQLVVNNLEDRVIEYNLDIGLEGPCIGIGCILEPKTTVEVDPSLGSVSIEIGNIGDLAAASFQFDKTSSGTFQLDIERIVGGSPVITPCTGQDNADFFIENCDLDHDTATTVHAIVTRVSGSGSTAIVRMGPDLVVDNAVPLPSVTPGAVIAGELTNFGEEDVYAFDVTTQTNLGLGFDESGIGTGENQIRVYEQADLDAVLRGDPSVVPIVEFNSTGDGGVAQPGPEIAASVSAGSYILVVDNDGLGTGEYDVCVGPDAADPEDLGTGIGVIGNLSGIETVTFNGALGCGDTDYVLLATDEGPPVNGHDVKIVVKEDLSGIPGNMDVKVQLLGGGGNWITLTSKSASRTATLREVGLIPGEDYRLVIDNDRAGNPAYTVTITDDD